MVIPAGGGGKGQDPYPFQKNRDLEPPNPPPSFAHIMAMKIGLEEYKMAAGKPRATTELLKLNGGFRPDRHSNRGDSSLISLPKDSILEPPSTYSAKAKKCWQAIVPCLITQRILSEEDLPSLDMMFNAYEEYERAKRAIKKFDKLHPDLLDKESIDNRKKLNTWMTQSITEFNKIAARFGIMPTERVRIQSVVDGDKPQDPLDVLLG